MILISCLCWFLPNYIVYVARGAGSPVWEEAEGVEESVCWRKSAEESSGHEAGQRVEAEHPQAEEEGNKGAACSRSFGVFNTITYWIHSKIHFCHFYRGSRILPSCISKIKVALFHRHCNQIHQKREEIAERIQEISGETQQLKAKIQSLRDVCSKETERAQVRLVCHLTAGSDMLLVHPNRCISTCAGSLWHAVHFSGRAPQENRDAHRRPEARRHQDGCKLLNVSFYMFVLISVWYHFCFYSSSLSPFFNFSYLY